MKTFYLTILLAIACLLSIADGSRAAGPPNRTGRVGLFRQRPVAGARPFRTPVRRFLFGVRPYWTPARNLLFGRR